MTLVGKDAGGGACVIARLSTADGTFFRFSGPMPVSTLTNGSYYDVDKGAEVDVPITQTDHFYDREALTEFLNGASLNSHVRGCTPV